MNWRRRFLGARDRLGWWTLPVFVMVGLGGAILAGALATVYYGQQVDSLKDETRQGREELRNAVDEVREAGDEALDAIGSEVDAVRDALDTDLPFDDVPARGVVSVRAFVGPEAAPPATEAPSPGAEGEESPEAPEPRYREERIGSGFAVAQEGAVAFIATTYALVFDRDAAGGVAETVEVTTPGGTFEAAVHSWDANRDLALLRAEVGDIDILEWRPGSAEVEPGDRMVVAGVTPSLDGLQIPGQLVHADVGVLFTDLPRLDLLRGAPIVDDRGLVVGIYATAYTPYGAGGGSDQAAVPARLLCERMLRNCEALESGTEESPTPSG